MSLEVKFSKKPIAYEEAMSFMEDRVAKIIEGAADELLWFLEHEPVFTAGTSAQLGDLISNDYKKFVVFHKTKKLFFNYINIIDHAPGLQADDLYRFIEYFNSVQSLWGHFYFYSGDIKLHEKFKPLRFKAFPVYTNLNMKENSINVKNFNLHITGLDSDRFLTNFL